MKKVKVGVFGAYRGSFVINLCERIKNVQVVAVCDKNPDVLEIQRQELGDTEVTFYLDYDEFIHHDMDAVVLANYANEHAPFAIQAMRQGKHVFSEVLPVQTMEEAVELIETVEQSGMIYAYGENYCYMPATYEMKKIYRNGTVGEFEYGECEYIENNEMIWPAITYGEENHWRNTKYSTFYCTHSLGPLIHITGLRPISVTGFEGTKTERNLRIGAKSGQFGMEIVTLENGGIVKSIHGNLYERSVWYSIYGSKGRMECPRELNDRKNINHIIVRADDVSGQYRQKSYAYEPKRKHEDISEGCGHGGADFYVFNNFIERICGNEDADIIDVYEAMDMFLPGMFAYRSILAGGIPMEIPNLRHAEERNKWRNDTGCTDPNVAGEMLWPTFSLGTPEIEPDVYEYMREIWEAGEQEDVEKYRSKAFRQGKKKAKVIEERNRL